MESELRKMTAALLTCSVCKHTARQPILISPEDGSLACGQCRPDSVKIMCSCKHSYYCAYCGDSYGRSKVRGGEDPTCRVEVRAVRATVIERLVHDLGLHNACRFHRNGCERQSPLDDLVDHEKVCDFRVVECPVGGTKACEDVVLKHFDEHLGEKHASIAESKGWCILNDHAAVCVVSAFDTKLMCFAELLSASSCWNVWVVAIGDGEDAGRFRCNVRLSSESGKLVQSIHSDVFSVDEPSPRSMPPNTADCFVVTEDVFTRFSGLNHLSSDKKDELGQIVVPFKICITDRKEKSFKETEREEDTKKEEKSVKKIEREKEDYCYV